MQVQMQEIAGNHQHQREYNQNAGEEDAEKVWDLIRGAFALSNAEKVVPDSDEISALNAYKAGDPDYQPSCSQDDLRKELGF